MILLIKKNNKIKNITYIQVKLNDESYELTTDQWKFKRSDFKLFNYDLSFKKRNSNSVGDYIKKFINLKNNRELSQGRLGDHFEIFLGKKVNAKNLVENDKDTKK